MHYSRRLGSNQALMIDDIKQSRLYQLRLHNRSDNLNQRLSRENNRTFGNCIDIARESERTQIVQEIIHKESC